MSLLPITRTVSEPIRKISQRLSIDIPNYPLYFSHVQHCIQKARDPDQRFMHLLLLSARALPHMKSKELSIDVSYNFYYFQHAHCHVQKARGSRSTLHAASITFSTCIVVYKKVRDSIGMCSIFNIWLTKFSKFFASQQIYHHRWFGSTSNPMSASPSIHRNVGNKWAQDHHLSRSGVSAPIDS
jgi:hypothetical protein